MQKLSSGTAHIIPKDLESAILSSKKTATMWENLTPLARNEWICWTISPKKIETREKHIKRVVEELQQGKRRPCCWAGCIHR